MVTGNLTVGYKNLILLFYLYSFSIFIKKPRTAVSLLSLLKNTLCDFHLSGYWWKYASFVAVRFFLVFFVVYLELWILMLATFSSCGIIFLIFSYMFLPVCLPTLQKSIWNIVLVLIVGSISFPFKTTEPCNRLFIN